jgi:hypothetical protein
MSGLPINLAPAEPQRYTSFLSVMIKFGGVAHFAEVGESLKLVFS